MTVLRFAPTAEGHAELSCSAAPSHDGSPRHARFPKRSANATILINVNGELVPRDRAVVSVFDAGFVLGDGVWEGLRVADRRPAFLELHLDRLWEGAAAIILDLGLTRAELGQRIDDTLRANAMDGDRAHIRHLRRPRAGAHRRRPDDRHRRAWTHGAAVAGPVPRAGPGRRRCTSVTGVRLAMWSGPRNISTALMRSWENRPDTRVVDEPLYAYYLDRTGLNHPGREERDSRRQFGLAGRRRRAHRPVRGRLLPEAT